MPKNSKKRNAKGAARPNAGSGQVQSVRVDSASVPTSSAGKHETRNEEGQPSWFARINLWIVAAMLLHVLIAGHAASTKSATFDEPVHVLSGLLQWRYGDYRLNPEHPPLWKHLAAMATLGLPMNVDLSQSKSQAMLLDLNAQERWAIEVLYQSDQNDGVKLIDRARLVMPIFGAIVVLFVGMWAQQLAGKIAGAFASMWAALDPSLLAHSGLVTNDVACTASLLACFFACYRVCQNASWGRIALFCVTCAVAACIKFTALALPLFLAPLAVLRIMHSTPWTILGMKTVLQPTGRVVLVAVLIISCGVTTWLSIWSVYGFRYLPTSDSNLSFNTQYPVNLYAHNQWMYQQLKAGLPIDKAPESGTIELGSVQSFCLFAHEHQLLPQAYLQGLAYAQAMSNVSQSFIDGQRQAGGSLWFFPKAWTYKTPMATQVAVFLGGLWLIWKACRSRWSMNAATGYLLFPYILVIVMAWTYSLNIGLRHLLPAFPIVWIGLGVAAGKYSSATSGHWGQRIAMTLLLLAATESLARHPNYIAYFNLVSRGEDQGLSRLSDSNLDWGQDLRLLAKWQKRNPEVPLYLSYFGSADPKAYGVTYHNVPPGYYYATATQLPDMGSTGVLAYSATWLQGAYLPVGPLRDQMDRIRRAARPLEVLGGTIYLYQLPLLFQDRSDGDFFDADKP